MATTYNHNDGGRLEAGHLGGASDCVTRALSIYAIGRGPHDRIADAYRAVFNEIRAIEPNAEREGINVFGAEFTAYMGRSGFVFIPLRYPIALRDFPVGHDFIVLTKNHVVAVMDGVVNDTFDCRDEMARGYWISNAGSFELINEDGKTKSGRLNRLQATKMRDTMYLNYKTKTWII